MLDTNHAPEVSNGRALQARGHAEGATSRVIATAERFGPGHYRPLPVVLRDGRGCWVTDLEGRRYLDLVGGFSALNHGHRHPRLIAAMERQLRRLTMSSHVTHNEHVGPLSRDLARLSGLDSVLLMNTGAEAVETAIKVARMWGERVKGLPRHQGEIVVCDNNFHGRTTTIVGFSSNPSCRDGFGPFAPGFRSVPFGDAGALAAAIHPGTIAVLMEPIQAEGGVVVPPAGFLRSARELCDRNDVLLILDEVQVGLGRTGDMFCHLADGVRPDVLLLGKSLTGGLYPVSAVVARAGVLDVLRPGEHGSTFGANPLGCAVAREALLVLEEERLPQRAAMLGAHFRHRLGELRKAGLEEVRGRGLLIGIRLAPRWGNGSMFCRRLLDAGILCKGTPSGVVRLLPPLVIRRDEIDWAVDRFERVLDGDPE